MVSRFCLIDTFTDEKLNTVIATGLISGSGVNFWNVN